MKINLLPKEERPLKQSQVRWEFVVEILGILFLAVVILLSVRANLTVQDLAAQEQNAQVREARLLDQVREVNEIRRDLTAGQKRQGEYLARILPASEAVYALLILSDHAFDRLWIETLRWEDSGVEILGYTQDPTSLSQYLYFLNERSDDVLLRSINTIGSTGFRVFRMDVKGVNGHDSTTGD